MTQVTKGSGLGLGAGRAPRGRAKNEAGVERAIAADAAKRQKRQGRGASQPLVVGGRPRADLLPTEVLVHRRERAVVRRLWGGVVIVAVVVGLGGGYAGMEASQAAGDLARAQADTLSILQQQQQYSDVRTTESETRLIQAGQSVGGSTEIAWGDYLAKVQSSLPSGVSITGVNVDSASPTEAYAQSDAPLQGVRIATLSFDATSSTLPSVPDWLNSVKGLEGFVDANANSVTLDPTSGSYTVNMTIHINEKAYDGKYSTDGDDK
jgi:hypothetical protein